MNVQELQAVAKQVRRDIIIMTNKAGAGHPGGSLSATEALVALYFDVMQGIDPRDDKNPNRDRFVLSKGHTAPGLYSVLANRGYFPVEDLPTLRHLGSYLQGHPCMQETPGVDMSSGSLGQGISAAVGMAVAGKMDNASYRVYTLLGDGELQEGSVWEAAMNAAHYNLNNITAIVDRNRLQIDGCTEKVMAVGDVAKKFESFGWNTVEIDGHNIQEIYKALEDSKNSEKPTVIVANTIKGKGVSYMENQAGWHGKCPNDEQLAQALAELN